MRCEREGCTKKAKLKLSSETGWIRCFCFRHSAESVKAALKTLHRYNTSLFIQKVHEKS